MAKFDTLMKQILGEAPVVPSVAPTQQKPAGQTPTTPAASPSLDFSKVKLSPEQQKQVADALLTKNTLPPDHPLASLAQQMIASGANTQAKPGVAPTSTPNKQPQTPNAANKPTI